jgi:predicted protein tyrosine phosphatase
MNILFVCSKNLSRSPTAESIYKDHAGLHVKSAGTEPSAGTEVTAEHIEWADLVFVMEKKHEQSMRHKFPLETGQKQIVLLDIPDEYKFMDPVLVEKITGQVSGYVDK